VFWGGEGEEGKRKGGIGNGSEKGIRREREGKGMKGRENPSEPPPPTPS